MYAVVDTETTGLSPHLRHRVAELAIILVDEKGQIESEFCTLLNPERDLGPQHIHGIRGADAIHAPKFSEVAGHVLGLLSGRTLVAHNLPFDLAFLDAEFDRLGVPFPLTRDMGVCTMAWSSRLLEGSGRSLRDCCAAANVPLTGWHSALFDTRATAGLLSYYISAAGGEPPWQELLQRNREVLWPKFDVSLFQACARSSAPQPPAASEALVSRLIDFMPRVNSSDVADPYLAVLDQALADRYLTADESATLVALARSLGLGDIDVTRLHRDYLNALARVAMADGQLSNEEAADLEQVADILGLPRGSVSAALEKANTTGVVRPTEGRLPLELGDMIVFTGDMAESREVWMQRAADHGYVPHPAVTKRVRLVVAADPDSLSGKAKKARGYDIPIMSVEDFRTALGYPTPPPGEPSATPNWGNSESQWAKILRRETGA